MPLQPVYSQLFIAASGLTSSSGDVTSAPVPVGYTGVVRCVTIVNYAAGAVADWVYAFLPGGTHVVIAGYSNPSGVSEPTLETFDLHVVVPAGAYFGCQVTAGSADFTVSGYLLTGTSPLG